MYVWAGAAQVDGSMPPAPREKVCFLAFFEESQPEGAGQFQCKSSRVSLPEDYWRRRMKSAFKGDMGGATLFAARWRHRCACSAEQNSWKWLERGRIEARRHPFGNSQTPQRMLLNRVSSG